MKRFKKGFTLVELLAVIVILGIILAIAIPNILNLINNSKEQAYESQKKFIIDAAKKYVMANQNLVFENNVATITLIDLKNEGLLPSTIKNPRDGEFDDDTVVIVTSSNGETAYDIATPDELLHKFITNSNPEGNSYRYKNGAHRFIGPDPNNWIEFGSIGGTPVMWRIIKKDDEGIQLIYEGLKNGASAPTDNGRIQIAGSWTPAWDTENSNKWERPATLKALLQDWYNTLTINNDLVNPINWCLGGSGQGINYPTDYVPTEHFLQTECIDGTYSGGAFLGKTNEKLAYGLIRVSDYISASDHPDCFGSYFDGPGSTEVDNGRRCGREVNEAGRTNYLWKPAYWYWTYTARAAISASVWLVHNDGHVSSNSASYSSGSVRPIINLKSDILYDSGEGTLENPYKVQ
jgi:type IV pilus assembly protein PilA